MEPINRPSNAPLEHEEPEFTLFNNLKNYKDHEAQILDTLGFEADLIGSDRKSGKELVQWLSLSLPPSVLFRENVMSNVRIFLTLYQFLMMNNFSMDRRYHCTVYEQIAYKLYTGQNLQSPLESFKSFHSLEESRTFKTTPGCTHQGHHSQFKKIKGK